MTSKTSLHKPLSFKQASDAVFLNLIDHVDIRAAKQKAQRKYYADTGYYPIRIMPVDKADTTVFEKLKAALESPSAKGAGINFEGIRQRMHSAKFASFLLEYEGKKLGVVLGAGSNKGEDFEKELLIKMQDHLAQTSHDEEAALAFAAIESVDKTIKIDDISEVKRREGSTRRSNIVNSDEVGKIIADIIIIMKDGTEHYVSVKDSRGETVANFGIADAFTADLTVNTQSERWTRWIKPFGVDPLRVSRGLQSYRDDIEEAGVKFNDLVLRAATPAMKNVLKRLWGTGYIYLRRTKHDFYSQKIDDAYMTSMLRGLKITEIRYPHLNSKQLVIRCQTAKIRMSIEIRNPNGPGQIKPKDMKLRIIGQPGNRQG